MKNYNANCGRNAIFGLIAVIVVLVISLGVDGVAYAQTNPHDGHDHSHGGTPDGTPTVIKIGALVEYTPSYDDTDNLKAMELSVDALNNDAGVSSAYRVELVPIDITAHLAAGNLSGIAVAVQQAIITQGITNFLGHSSHTIVPAKMVLDTVPGSTLISYGSSAPIAPLPDGTVVNLAAPGDSLFRLVPSDTYQTASVINLVVNEDGNDTIIVVVRSQWAPVVGYLISPEIQHLIADPVIPMTEGETFATPADAIASHTELARTLDAKIAELVGDGRNTDNIALVFVGYPIDFVYHAKAVQSSGDALENLRSVQWYTTATITGENTAIPDSQVAGFADSVNLVGTRYTVQDNAVNMGLCADLAQQGIVCNAYEYSPFASYDAIHLIVDAVIRQNQLATDGIAGNERTARSLIPDVAAGLVSHHHDHEGRTIGDGALGAYTLNAAGDLEEPSTYTVLEATTDLSNPWTVAVDDPPEPVDPPAPVATKRSCS